MFENSVVTNVGRALLARWASGGSLTIDGARGGTGTVQAATLMAATELVSEVMEIAIAGVKSGGDGVTQFRLSLTAQESAAVINQIGLFAHLDEEEPVLLAIYQDDGGIQVPSMAEMSDFVYTFQAAMAISNADGDIVVNVDSASFVTTAMLDEALAGKADASALTSHTVNTSNPHAVTAAQVGAATTGALESHTGNTGNPHSVTAAQVGAATTALYTATLLASAWTGDAAPYSQAVAVSGLLDTDTPFVDIVQTGSEDTDSAMRDGWGLVTRITTANGSITAYASEIPGADIHIQMKVVR